MRVNLILPKPLLDALKAFTERTGLTMSETLRAALREYLERNGG